VDATRLPQTYSFTPSLDTQANRAYDKVANIATKVQSAYDMALSADGIAKGTRTTLVNKNGCVYDDTFDCTNDNLTSAKVVLLIISKLMIIIFIFFMVFLLFLFKNYSQ
jgi:hypothetical protein